MDRKPLSNAQFLLLKAGDRVWISSRHGNDRDHIEVVQRTTATRIMLDEGGEFDIFWRVPTGRYMGSAGRQCANLSFRRYITYLATQEEWDTQCEKERIRKSLETQRENEKNDRERKQKALQLSFSGQPNTYVHSGHEGEDLECRNQWPDRRTGPQLGPRTERVFLGGQVSPERRSRVRTPGRFKEACDAAYATMRRRAEVFTVDIAAVERRMLANRQQEQSRDINCNIQSAEQDIHLLRAVEMFGVRYEDVTKEQRSVAKADNFGRIYANPGLRSYSGDKPDDIIRF